jgi:hypothetical protein
VAVAVENPIELHGSTSRAGVFASAALASMHLGACGTARAMLARETGTVPPWARSRAE